MNFPSVPLVDLSEKNQLFSDLLHRDKLNLILFYNTNCLGCTGRAIPLAYQIQKEYDFISLIVIHSSFRPIPFTSEEVLSVFTDHESPFTIYRETNHELYDFFKCEGTPHWLIMDGKGEILHTFFGSQDGAQLKLRYAIEEYEERL